jgi:hypothetical protein
MNITIERLEQIENERNKTMGDKHFQQWMRDLNVSQSCQDKTPIIRAYDIIKQYDYSDFRLAN